MTKQEVAAMLAYFAAAYPNFDPTEATAEVWLREVAEVDSETARDAMHAVVRTSEYVPTIAKFLFECAVVREQRSHRLALAAGIPTHKGVPMPKELLEASKALLKQQRSNFRKREAS